MAVKRSWETSASGIGAILVAIGSALKAQFDGDPLTVPDWGLVISLGVAGFGLLRARDNNKNSEEIGADPLTKELAAAEKREVTGGIVSLWLLLAGLLVFGAIGCHTARLESGGAYAPVGTNGVALVEPDYAFFVVDAAFLQAYRTADAAFTFELQNEAWLFKVAPQVKHRLDEIRPAALKVRDTYADARIEYLKQPTPAGLSTLQQMLSRAQAIALSAAAALPK